MKHLRTTPTTGTTFHRTLLTTLAGLLCLLLVGSGALAGAAHAAEEGGPTGWLRVGHLSPGTPKADVRLAPFSGGRARTLTQAEFGDLSSYERVPTGTYTLSLVDSTTPDADAMLSRNVEVSEGGAATVIATGRGQDVRTTVLQDDLTPPAEGKAKVRLISAAVDPDSVEASVVDGPVLARDLRTGAATGYADVDAQTWQVELRGTGGATASSRVPVEAGGTYTLVALDAPSGGLELRAVQDSGSSTSAGAMPSGGVDAGAGGNVTAQHRDHTCVLAGGAALLAALATGSTLALRRRATS